MKKQKKLSNEQTSKYNRPITTGLVFAFFLFIIFFTTSKLTNEDDYFWHLATGRYIVQNNSIPNQDVFSFPTLGQPWLVTEWGWDVLTFLIFNSFSFLGLSVLNSVVYLIFFGSYLWVLRKLKLSYSLIILLFVVLAFGMFERLTPRPHIVSYVFFAILLSLLINLKYADRTSIKKLFLIPIIFLFWANMHIGCIIGLVIFGCYLVCEFIIYFKPRIFSSKEQVPLTKKELLNVLLIFCMSIVAMLINPHGINTYIYAIASQKNSQMLHEAVMEWISPFNSRVTGKLYNDIFIFFLIGYLSVLFYAFKRKDLFAGVLCTLFAINSVRALRFTVDYQIIVFPFFIVSLEYLIGKLKNADFRRYLSDKIHVKAFILVLLIFLIAIIPDNRLYLKYLKYARFAGIGVDENYYPVKMFDFIRQNKINEIGNRPFNTFECGGYFIWNFPEQKDFFDSRDLNNYIMNEYQTLISRLPGFEQKIDHYDFDYAICVIPDIVSEPQIMKQSIISFFASQNDKWKLVFWNDRSLLFVKNLPKFEQIINMFEFKYFTPYNMYYQKNVIETGFKDDKKTVKNEIDRKRNEEPSGIFLNTFIANNRNKLF